MFRTGLALALLAVVPGGWGSAASPDPAALAVPPEKLSKARLLVEQLASPAFRDRQVAQKQLAAMGRFALPALVEGRTSHTSAEVRFRCQSLLPRAAAADLKARVDTFLADTDGEYDHDLPGWDVFREAVGRSPAAREVFVELIADPDNRDLVLAAGDPDGGLSEMVAARKQELYRWRYPRTPTTKKRTPEIPDVMALLFAESRVSTPRVSRAVSVSLLFNAADVRDAASADDDRGELYRALLTGWMVTRDDASSLYQGMTLGQKFDIPETAEVAARLLRLKGATPYYRGQAAMFLAQLEAFDRLTDVETLFDDQLRVTTVRIRNNGVQVSHEIQLRDIGLAAALLLTGQEPTDYGFTPRSTSSTTSRYRYSNWYFAEEGERETAFDRWKAWRAEHPNFGKGD